MSQKLATMSLLRSDSKESLKGLIALSLGSWLQGLLLGSKLIRTLSSEAAENFIPRDVVCCRPRKALEPKFWILNVGADKAESNHPTMIGRSKAKSYFRFVSFCFVPF